MKKIIGVVCLLFVFLISTNQKVFANENELLDDFTLIASETEYFEDGSYIIYETLERKNDAVFLTTSYTKTGKRTVTKTGNDGKVLWTYVLSAEYWIEEGISANCTKADYSTTISNSSWSFSNGSANYSGNTAYGKGKFTYKVLWLFPTQNVNIDIQLSCDSYGNLS